MIRAVRPLQPIKAAIPPEKFVEIDLGFVLSETRLPVYPRLQVVPTTNQQEEEEEEDEEPRDAFRRTRRQAIDADREHKLPELGGMIW